MFDTSAKAQAMVSDALDFQGLRDLRRAAQEDQVKALREAASQFEAIFLQQTIKQMRQASLGDQLVNSSSMDMYQDLYDQQMALALSKGKGIGLAEMLTRQLGRTLQQAGEDGDNPMNDTVVSTTTVAGGKDLPRNGVSVPVVSLSEAPDSSAQKQFEIGKGESDAVTALANGVMVRAVELGRRHFSGVALGESVAAFGVLDESGESQAASAAESVIARTARGLAAYGASPMATASAAAEDENTVGAVKAAASSSSAGTVVVQESSGDGPLAHARAFIASILPAAREAGEKLGVNPRAVLAHAALETGWGKHMPGDGNNLFGIKASGSWHGQRTDAITTEYQQGVETVEQASFRDYSARSQSVDDYVQLLTTSSRYEGVQGHGDDVAAYARSLQQAGYATDPRFADKISSVADGPTMRKVLLSLGVGDMMAG